MHAQGAPGASLKNNYRSLSYYCALFIIIIYYMTVKFAYYGLACSSGVLKESNQQHSTKWIARLCDGKFSCQSMVHNSVLTDPYPGCSKDSLLWQSAPMGR